MSSSSLFVVVAAVFVLFCFLFCNLSSWCVVISCLFM